MLQFIAGTTYYNIAAGNQRPIIIIKSTIQYNTAGIVEAHREHGVALLVVHSG